MRFLGDGRHDLPVRAEYVCQFATASRVSEFLDAPDTLATDDAFRSFGFDKIDDYVKWAPRLCGLVCLKMVIDGYHLAPDETIATLTSTGVELGGYRFTDGAGRPAERGWYYAPLIELGRRFGLEGKIFSGYSREQLCAEVLDGRTPVASVHPGVIRGDIDQRPPEASGGHLVVVIAFITHGGEVTDVVVHNPSGRVKTTQAECRVPVARFDEAFAGRGFLLWKA